jgi:type I restriction enzyme S subunit
MCNAPQPRTWLTPHIKSAAGQHGISGGDLKKLPIPLPKLDDQIVLARQLGGEFNRTDELVKQASGARRLIEHLDQSILAKAFKGEFVPQDPNDEPASVLLERIKAERVANEIATNEKQPRRNVRPKVRLVRLQKSGGERKART